MFWHVYTIESITTFKTLNYICWLQKFPSALLCSLPQPRQPLIVFLSPVIPLRDVNGITQYVFFGLLFSLYIIILLSFQLMSSIPLCRYIPQFITYWSTLGLFPVFAYYKQNCYQHSCTQVVFIRTSAFISPVWILRNRMTRSYGRCIFNLLINCQTVFQSTLFKLVYVSSSSGSSLCIVPALFM